MVLPPGEHLAKCLETFLIVTTWGEKVCSWDLGIEDKDVAQHSVMHNLPQQRMIWPQISIVLWLRTPGLEGDTLGRQTEDRLLRTSLKRVTGGF